MARNLDLEEQEKLDELKAWWNRWGNIILTGATVVLLAIAGYNGWNWYQRSQAAEAAAKYELVQQGAEERDTKKVRDAAGEIIERHGRTLYAPLAAMVSAKVHFEAGDLKTARSQLEWVMANAKDADLQSLARLRLANVLVDEKAYDEALKVIGDKMGKAFMPIADGLRGDILALQGRKGDARAAFKSALDKADAKDSSLRERLQLKLDALGEG